MTQEQVDKLLAPRYKCLGRYPQSPFITGHIYTNRECCEILNPKNVEGCLCVYNCDKYPLIFQKLQWWEDRTPEEMPEYVKLSPETTDADGDDNRVFKVTALRKSDDCIMMICYADDPNDGDPFDPFNHPKYFLPATATEFLNYQQSKA